jgi:amino acid transporter
MATETQRPGLGVAACTAIVIGNMVGSGFYLSPTLLAPYGLLAILFWIVMGIGALCLGLTFARLARRLPATGGPYAYTRAAYGDFAGFIVAWGYWISIWASLPVMAAAFTGSMVNFVPVLQTSHAGRVAITIAVIWFVSLTNLRGVRTAGIVSMIATYAKLVPLVGLAIIGLAYVQWDRLSDFNPSGQSIFEAGAALAPLTMFAFLGLESATVPAGDVRDPERTIPRSTVLGISVAACLYVLCTIVIFGIVPRGQLVKSVAPFADAGRLMWGPWGALLVSMAINMSSIGALNGWTLVMGQVPMAAAADRLFPPIFGRLSKRGVPAAGIMISASLATALVLVDTSGNRGFASVYAMIVGLATMTGVLAYAFCALADGLIAAGGAFPRLGLVEVVAFTFSLFTIYGCGPAPVMYGLVLLLLGIPVFVWQRRDQLRTVATHRAR